MPKPKIAVVGAGHYGRHVLDVLAAGDREDELELSAVAEIDSSRLAAACKEYNICGYTDYKEMLEKEKPAALAVVTPDHLHEEIVLYALNRKIHVLCQKPLATNSRAGRAMLAAAKKADTLLYVDYHKRFDPAHRQLKADIAAGRLGQILYGDVYMEDRLEVPAEWFPGWAHMSSPAWFLGTHFYDLVSWLTGALPELVLARGNKVKLSSLGIDTLDHVSALVTYDNGAVLSYQTSWILPGNFPSIVNQKIRLVGSEGICEVDSQDRGMQRSYSSETGYQVVNPFSKTGQADPLGLPLSGYTCDSIRHFWRLLHKLDQGESLAQLEDQYPGGQGVLIATALGEAVERSLASNTEEKVLL